MGRPTNVSSQTRALIAALELRPADWRHGYELSKVTGLKSGTLYPLLIRLANQGFLETNWQESDQPNRPRRHIYRLTATGLALARSLAASPPSARSKARPA